MKYQNLPNSTTEIKIPQIPVSTPLTVIVFTSLDNVLPTRDTSTSSTNDTSKLNVRINGDVVVVQVDNKIINTYLLRLTLLISLWEILSVSLEL